ncbi:MAG: 2-nitropropane dioxygenase [Microvirga sp.]|nr:2-nitropropane dioxygenase [Microvirga sp.]
MTRAKALLDGLRLPVIAAPMFLVSGPALVIAASRAGVLGTFPALNQRSTEGFRDWLEEIEAGLSTGAAALPYGVNLIVHKTNPRVEADLRVCVEKRVPVIITSLGAVPDLVKAVHSYGGVVLHDVINMRHAAKAIEAGVDGLVLVSAGAGGHAGTNSPFAFVSEVRRIFPQGVIALAGAITTGRHVAAAIAAGADVAYMGTRFIATEEGAAPPAYKQMILDSRISDIVYTPAVSGVHGNFMRDSLVRAGLNPDGPAPEMNMDKKEAKAWRDIWSAGHGVGGIDAVMPTQALVAELGADFDCALGELQRWRAHAPAPAREKVA